MSNMVNQVAATDIVATTAKRTQTPKEQNADSGKFVNMLSDAINGKQNEAVQPPKTAEESTSAKNGTEQTPAQTQSTKQAKPAERPSAENTDDDITYEQQAAAMQMQVMIPIIVETPQAEISEEISAAADLQPVQTETGIQEGVSATGEANEKAKATQDIPSQTVKGEDAVMAEPITNQAVRTTDTVQNNNDSINQTETQNAQPQTMQTQATQQEPTAVSSEAPKDTTVETAISGDTETQALRRPRVSVQMHNIQSPREAEEAQAKFDGMLARASRGLNSSQNTAAETQQADEIPEETVTTGQSVILEAKPQETAKQSEITEAELKPQEETKPTAQATVQKDAEAPVTKQRPQKEISKPDETVLDMVQPKQQPEIRPEIMRSETAPQQPQQIRQPEQAEQIKAQIIKNMESERTEFQMQLQPEELGKVNVKMILEGGKISVEIAAANPKSAEMLSKQVESLAASLKAGGTEISSINVVTANENVSAQMNSEYNFNNFQNRFQNRENGQNGQGQNGRSKGTGTSAEQAAGIRQAERERPRAPQRILNYSV